MNNIQFMEDCTKDGCLKDSKKKNKLVNECLNRKYNINVNRDKTFRLREARNN